MKAKILIISALTIVVLMGSGCIQTPVQQDKELIKFTKDNIYYLNWGYFTYSKTICEACNNSYDCKLTPSFEFKIINVNADLQKYGFACDVDINNKHNGTRASRIGYDDTVLFVPTDEIDSNILVRISYKFDLCCYLYDVNANVDDAKTVRDLYKPVSDTVCQNYTIPESNCIWK